MAGEESWASGLDGVAASGSADGQDPKGDGSDKKKPNKKPSGSDGSGDGSGGGDGKGQRLSPEEMAARFGYAWSTIQDEPELVKVFTWAAKQGPQLTQEAFAARLQGTSWWTDHSSTWRTAYVQEHASDETWSQVTVPSKTENILIAAGSLGVTLSDSEARSLAVQSIYGGWSAERINSELVRGGESGFGGLSKDPETYQDKALTTYRWLEDLAKQNGVVFTRDWYRSQVSRVLDPLDKWSESDVSTLVFKAAKSKYPALADQIGQFGTSPNGTPIVTTARDAMSPYLTRIAEGLELQVDNVSLDDRLIESALTANGQMSMWDLQSEIRKDDRWFNTSTAVKTFDSLATGLAARMGVVA